MVKGCDRGLHYMFPVPRSPFLFHISGPASAAWSVFSLNGSLRIAAV